MAGRRNPRSKLMSLLLSGIVISPAFPVFAEDEATRGLKSRVPVKPFFEEPRFKEQKPEPLETPKLLPKPPQTSESPEQVTSELSDSPKLNVTRVEVIGSTIFSEQELRELVKSYEGRVVSIDELQALRQQLSVAYFERGYVNSGVIIPDQDVKDGVVQLTAIEGQLTKLNLSGNEDLRDSYVLDRINLGVGTPLNVNDLQSSLRDLQQNRLIKKINAQLKPAETLGQAELDVSVSEAESRSITLIADNHRSPSVGAEQGTLVYSDNNLTGRGDALALSVSGSEGLVSGSVNYDLPLNPEEMSLGFFYSASETEVIEEPFDQLNIESKSRNYGVNFSLPWYKENGEALSFSAGLTLKDSDSFLLGEPFSFSMGAIEGESKSTVIELGGEYIQREASQVYALSLTLRKGIDALDSNIASDSDAPDSEFTAFLGQAQYARRFEFLPAGQLIARTAFQLSLDPLLSIEKFAVGGYSTVRGYRENQLVRDNGVTASLELRIAPLVDDSGLDPYNFKIAPFLDWGRAWDEDVPGQLDESVSIYSAGLGLLWEPIAGLNADVYWGEALEDEVKSSQGDDLQDDGIHFSLSYSHSF